MSDIIRGVADKFLARPTSRCRRTESIASLERGVSSCVESQVFQVTEAERKHVRRRARFQQHGDASCHQVFFFCKAKCWRKFTPLWQKHKGNTHHRVPPSKTGWSNLNVVIFPPVMRLVLDDKNSDHPGNYWSNSQANLGRTPYFGEINSWASERVGSIIHEDLDMRKLSAK